MVNKIVAVTLTARTGAYAAQMAAAAKATAGVGAAANTAAVAAQPLGRSLRNTARATGILNPKLLGPAGLVFGLKSVIGQAYRFEDQFAMVRKTMQESDEVLDQVALNLREMAKDMPVTTGELNQIATVAGQLGIAADDVTGFTETIAKLSVTTNLTAEGAAIDFARLSNIMGKPISEVSELGNVVVHLGNNMAAQETEIMEFAKRIAGVGTQMGMTEAEILALSAALPALGLRAEMGGTAITRIMVEMNAAVTEGGERLELFARTAGMAAGEFAESWRADPAATLLTFTGGIGEMSDAGIDAFEVIADMDLSMIRTQDTMLRLAGGTDIYREAQRLANEEMENQTAVQVEWEKRMNTTASQFGILKNNVRDFALEVGGPLNEALGKTLRLMNDMASTDRGFWNSLADMTALRGVTQDLGIEGMASEFFGTTDQDLMPWREASAEIERRIFDAWKLWFTGDFFKDSDVSNEMADFLSLWFTGDFANRNRPTGGTDVHGVDPWTLSSTQFNMMGAEADNYVYSLEAAAAANGGFARSAGNVAGSLYNAREALDDYMEAVRAATDPVYALESASRALADAEAEYVKVSNDAEATQRERETAAFNLFRALNDLERAALDGELAFGAFEDQLARMVAQGEITAEAANEIRERVAELNEEADRFERPRHLTLHADDAEARDRVLAYRHLLNDIPSTLSTKLTFSYNSPVMPGGASGQAEKVHTGGFVHPSGSIQKFHGGGMVGGLKSDEVPAILQTGEMVLSRHQVSQIGAAFGNARETLRPAGGDGASSPMWGEVHFHGSDVDDTLRAAHYRLRVAQFQGVYA